MKNIISGGIYQMKQYFYFLLILLKWGTSFAQLSEISGRYDEAGGGGNGGDFIRSDFIEIGKQILRNHKQSLEENLKKFGFAADVKIYEDILSIYVIRTSTDLLFDNSHSEKTPVSALGWPSSAEKRAGIILYVGEQQSLSWGPKLTKRDDRSDLMVLHEMMRAVGVRDDNYIESSTVLKMYDVQVNIMNEPMVGWLREIRTLLKFSLNFSETATTYEESLKQMKQSAKEVDKLLPNSFKYLFSAYQEGVNYIFQTALQPKHKFFIGKDLFIKYEQSLSALEKYLIQNHGLWKDSEYDHAKQAGRILEDIWEIGRLVPSVEVEAGLLDYGIDTVLENFLPKIQKKSSLLAKSLEVELRQSKRLNSLDEKRAMMRKMIDLLGGH